MVTIDLNCDLGEGGPYDSEMLGLVTSVNVACGFHAGDPQIACAVLADAARRGVRVGAHPSFPDREHFGRVMLDRAPERVFEDCVWQIGALEGMARSWGLRLTHCKPHGALYHLACQSEAHARAVHGAARLFGLPVVGMPGSCLQRGFFLAEGFADRRYLPDGSLVPREREDALIQDPEEAACQVERLMREQQIRTVCVHGDHTAAPEFARGLRAALAKLGIQVCGPDG